MADYSLAPVDNRKVSANRIDDDPRWKNYGIRPGTFGYDSQRYLGLDLFPGASSQGRFASGIEPGRQNAISNFISWLSPGSELARTERGITGMLNQGAGVGDQMARGATAQGFGSEYALALRNIQRAKAIRDANAYRASMGDRMGQAYEQMMKAYEVGQQTPMIEQLLPLLFANKMGAQQPKEKDDTLGLLAGLAGTVLGGPIGGKLFK